jgi:hypothetical protein
MELIGLLTRNLGVQEEQARGGAGLVFQLAKQRLEEEDFSKVAHFVPNMNELLAMASDIGATAGTFEGLGSAIGGRAVLGNLTGLASGFSKLGLDTRTMGEFVPIVLSYLQSQGGESIKGLVERALK